MADKNQKNKIKTAVALGYDPNEDGAPKVIASGKGALADKIIEQVYFNKEKDGTVNFAIKLQGDQWGRAEFSSGNYSHIAKTFKIALAADDEVIIDTDWALAILEKQM